MIFLTLWVAGHHINIIVTVTWKVPPINRRGYFCQSVQCRPQQATNCTQNSGERGEGAACVVSQRSDRGSLRVVNACDGGAQSVQGGLQHNTVCNLSASKWDTNV